MKKGKEELLQAALFDGAAPETDEALRELLANDPEAAQELDRLRRTAALLASMPMEAAPPELTARIVAALPRENLLVRIYRQTRARLLAMRCAYYLFFVGILHLMLGASLYSMLKVQAAQAAIPAWLLWQPELALGSGVFFVLCGLLLHFRMQHAARISYYGLLVYIAVITGNALYLLLQNPGPKLLPGLLAYAGMGLTMGGFIGSILQDKRKGGQS